MSEEYTPMTESNILRDRIAEAIFQTLPDTYNQIPYAVIMAAADAAVTEIGEVTQRRRRRVITTDLLLRAAEIHNRTEEGERIKAVIKEFCCSKSTANRYIRAAKQEGFIK